MKRILVKDLRGWLGKEVESDFLVARKVIKSTRDGSPYLELLLGDASGYVKGVAFDAVRSLDNMIEEGRVMRIRGLVDTFNEMLQIKVQRAQVVDDFDVLDFVPKTEEDLDALVRRFREIQSEVLNPYLRELLCRIFDDEEFFERFKLAPAAKGFHQNYLGGLLEHTVRIAEMAQRIAPLYRVIDVDLLVTGALVHDISKVEEFTTFPAIDYTDIGRMIGHIPLGYRFVLGKIEGMADFRDGFPEDLSMKLLHMILSHHGQQDWGSPVVPKIVEAQVLHYLDNMEAKIWMFRDAENYRVPGTRWSEWMRNLERFVYLGEEKEEGET
jgi:3'-5' exoribonuclease